MAQDQIFSFVALGSYAVILLVVGFVLAWMVGIRRSPTKVILVMCFLVLGFAPIVVQSARGKNWVDWFLPRMDTPGGIELVFEVTETGSNPPMSQVMDRLAEVVTKRVDGARLGVSASVARSGANRIAVYVPHPDAASEGRIQRLVTTPGTLEFAILANRRDHGPIIDAALAKPDADLIVAGKIVARWRPIAPDRTPDGTETPHSELAGYPDIAVRQMAGKLEGFHEVLALYEADERYRITGRLLRRANPTRDREGGPAVGFHFTQEGGYLFHDLTSRNKPAKDNYHRQLAIILNEEVVTAPMINQPIGADGIIESSRFTEKEVDDLVDILNAGALPIPLKAEPVSVNQPDSVPEYHTVNRRSGVLFLAAHYLPVLGVVTVIGSGFLWLSRLIFGRRARNGHVPLENQAQV
jgi:SecD/SecF fusion protein